MYGPGDAQTWPSYTGHPNDPRNDEPDPVCLTCGAEVAPADFDFNNDACDWCIKDKYGDPSLSD